MLQTAVREALRTSREAEAQRDALQQQLQQHQAAAAAAEAAAAAVQAAAAEARHEAKQQLLQTSCAVRTADCSAYLEVTDMQKLAQFCAWLPQHAGLVDSLSLASWSDEPAGLADNWPAAQQLITTALQQSVQVSSYPAMDSLSSTSSLNMHWCFIPYPTTPALLDALAAVSSLRHLSLFCASSQPTAAVCAALGRLRNIRELHLENAEDSEGAVTTELAVAVQQLQQLKSSVRSTRALLVWCLVSSCLP